MVTNATPEMLPRMNELWNEIFGDSLEYSSFFFENNLKGKDRFYNQLVYLVEGQPVSMLTVLEAELKISDERKKFWYIYAVLTDPNYRKRGYAGKVLDYVTELAKSQHIIVGLVPANDSLYSYYEKFGFKTLFNKRVKTISLEEERLRDGLSIKLEEIDCSEYQKLRDEAFLDYNYVIWNKDSVRYALQENENLGGKAYVWSGTDYFLLVCPSEDELIVRETNLPSDKIEIICYALKDIFNCKKAVVTLPPFGNDNEKSVRHGMVYSNEKYENMAYLGLALD